jgi:hypothetical protein
MLAASTAYAATIVVVLYYCSHHCHHCCCCPLPSLLLLLLPPSPSVAVATTDAIAIANATNRQCKRQCYCKRGQQLLRSSATTVFFFSLVAHLTRIRAHAPIIVFGVEQNISVSACVSKIVTGGGNCVSV